MFLSKTKSICLMFFWKSLALLFVFIKKNYFPIFSAIIVLLPISIQNRTRNIISALFVIVAAHEIRLIKYQLGQSIVTVLHSFQNCVVLASGPCCFRMLRHSGGRWRRRPAILRALQRLGVAIEANPVGAQVRDPQPRERPFSIPSYVKGSELHTYCDGG